MSDVSREARMLGEQLFPDDVRQAMDAADAIQGVIDEAIIRERRRLDLCPDCGSADYVYADEGDFDRTCVVCRLTKRNAEHR